VVWYTRSWKALWEILGLREHSGVSQVLDNASTHTEREISFRGFAPYEPERGQNNGDALKTQNERRESCTRLKAVRAGRRGSTGAQRRKPRRPPDVARSRMGHTYARSHGEKRSYSRLQPAAPHGVEPCRGGIMTLTCCWYSLWRHCLVFWSSINAPVVF